MKNLLLRIPVILLLFSTVIESNSQTTVTTSVSVAFAKPDSIRYSDFFTTEALRIDFVMAGNHSSEKVYLERMLQEPSWSGPHKNLIDTYNLGSYRIVLQDSASGKIIFTRGFCNLFQEWQGTEEASKTERAFEQCAMMPFPLKTAIFRIDKRKFEDGQFSTLFGILINPADYFILREKPHPVPFVKFRDSGNPENKVDIAFIAEGYKQNEIQKFLSDAKRIGDYFLTLKPYSDYPDRFNFYAVEAPSDESGVDIPGDHTYVNTNINSSFYTFNTDRYMTTNDARAIYDLAAGIPYDAIVVLVNSKVYGGGGFLNFYAESTVDNIYSSKVAVHEFGHSFAGLADEYVGSVNYSDFYNLNVEPWEPNITTNIDFSSKWKNMIRKGTPVPTPREEEFDTVVGMFEGGGYLSKGMYSPAMECRMNTNEAPGFCPVCQSAILRMIRFYCDE
jgi:hypothetical protein